MQHIDTFTENTENTGYTLQQFFADTRLDRTQQQVFKLFSAQSQTAIINAMRNTTSGQAFSWAIEYLHILLALATRPQLKFYFKEYWPGSQDSQRAIRTLLDAVLETGELVKQKLPIQNAGNLTLHSVKLHNQHDQQLATQYTVYTKLSGYQVQHSGKYTVTFPSFSYVENAIRYNAAAASKYMALYLSHQNPTTINLHTLFDTATRYLNIDVATQIAQHPNFELIKPINNLKYIGNNAEPNIPPQYLQFIELFKTFDFKLHYDQLLDTNNSIEMYPLFATRKVKDALLQLIELKLDQSATKPGINGQQITHALKIENHFWLDFVTTFKLVDTETIDNYKHLIANGFI